MRTRVKRLGKAATEHIRKGPAMQRMRKLIAANPPDTSHVGPNDYLFLPTVALEPARKLRRKP